MNIVQLDPTKSVARSPPDFDALVKGTREKLLILVMLRDAANPLLVRWEAQHFCLGLRIPDEEKAAATSDGSSVHE